MTLRFKTSALIAATFILAACAGSPAERQTAAQDAAIQPYVRLAPSAPPQNLLETKPQPTLPMKQIWRPGHWDYDGAKFNWIAGSYMLRPDPTATWIADRWEKHTYGWAYIPGHWK